MERSIEPFLEKWIHESDRMPILLRGARQVGKTYVIEKFGNTSFKNVVVANFEFQRKFSICFDSLEPSEIIQKIESVTNSRIKPGETLLFLDEIQVCPEAILALRYFKEKMPELHVIAAGSLLEFILQENKYSFPVGRVQFMYLKPLSFEEFLLNCDQHILLERIKSVGLNNLIDETTHQKLLEFIRLYLFVGGMPAALKKYLETKSLIECQRLQNSILQTYKTDFGKYATKTQHKYLQILFERAPALIGKRFKFSDVDSEVRSRELKVALEQLCWAGLLNCVYVTSASGVPLKSQKKEDRLKLLFLDIGLLQCAMEMDYEAGFNDSILQINSGSIAEQFVGQELLVYGEVFQNKEVFYWEREKRGSQAEVDYVIQQGADIIPIEVKAGKTGRLRSLQQFMEEKGSKIGIRISQKPLRLENNILSIPFYLIGHLKRLINESLER